jgi:hypothetical protein
MRRFPGSRVQVKGVPRGYVTVQRAMQIAHCSEVTIRRAVRRQILEVMRWRGRVILKERSIRQWLKASPYVPAKQGPLYRKHNIEAPASTAAQAATAVRT